jgi:hypothetical protein
MLDQKNVEMDLDIVCFRLSWILNLLPAFSMVDEGLNYKSILYIYRWATPWPVIFLSDIVYVEFSSMVDVKVPFTNL